ncbi:MAG: HEAT repeat domain-containing protein [Planctomycetes bacterium]|nr:HEAT repeat domain-containing protein [Planctomycetota bacterium]
MQPLVKWAVESLGSLKVDEAVPPLLELLKDEEARVRWAAVVALGRIGRGRGEAATALREALQDADDEVREAAAWALTRVERPTTGA